ncbi:MAG: methyltransferase domain-containing protein [Deltaproteobacteria bacterium]|nr:methyltransferase domain-containing protein [Deltaproteobacteria bacterium]
MEKFKNTLIWQQARKLYHNWVPRFASPHSVPSNLRHRGQGYRLLKGEGIEIGALHQPAHLPTRCHVRYLDCMSKKVAVGLFPEVDANQMVEVDWVVDLDCEDARAAVGKQFDFVIANHIIEHVANPIRFLEQLFNLTKKKGLLVLSAPDKDFTFDKARTLTPFEHLLQDFNAGVTEASEDHYLDFLRGVHPEVFETEQLLQQTLSHVRRRKEHVHVWDSRSFKDFVERTLKDVLRIKAKLLVESIAQSNKLEYFSVWRKQSDPR